MQYIVLDMEWNQPWPGSPSAKKVLDPTTWKFDFADLTIVGM